MAPAGGASAAALEGQVSADLDNNNNSSSIDNHRGSSEMHNNAASQDSETSSRTGGDSVSDATEIQEEVAIAAGMQRRPAGAEGDLPMRHTLRNTVHLHSGVEGAALRCGRQLNSLFEVLEGPVVYWPQCAICFGRQR